MEQATIPTLNNPERIELEGGGSVHVRRMKVSVQAQLMDIAKFSSMDDPAGALRFAVQALRWGIVEAEEIPDPDNRGKFIELVTRTKRGVHGNLANTELVDALHRNNQEDYNHVLSVILGDEGAGLSEEQEGNSESSQHGSTEDE